MTRSSRPRKPRGEGPTGGSALAAALAMLSRRALSEGEIRVRLIRKGFTEPEAESALGRLRELGLADDRSLCGRLARYYRCERRIGPRRIAAMLAVRRFPRGLVEEALGRIRPDEEMSAARAALAKKFREGIPPGREAAAKAYRFLAGRGFSPEICREAIRGGPADIEEGEG